MELDSKFDFPKNMSNVQEEKLFLIKSKFLRDIPHPKLIWKAVEQTKDEEINPENEQDISAAINVDKFSDLLPFLKNHTDDILAIKLQIANSNSFSDLHLALKDLYKNQLTLINCLATYLPKLEIYPDDSLKISDPIDTYSLTKFIETTQLAENEIKTYICTSISNKSVADFDVLTIACLRSRKIVVNAGSV